MWDQHSRVLANFQPPPFPTGKDCSTSATALDKQQKKRLPEDLMEWLSAHSKEKALFQLIFTISILVTFDVMLYVLTPNRHHWVQCTVQELWMEASLPDISVSLCANDNDSVHALYEELAWVLLDEKVSCVHVLSLYTEMLQIWMWRWVEAHGCCRDIKDQESYLCSDFKFRMNGCISNLLTQLHQHQSFLTWL